jgi:5-methylcytosine-specific restriction protein A
MTIISTFRKTIPKEKQTGRKYRAEWYDTRRWRAERLQHLQQNPLCVHCIENDIITPATILDHIKNIASYKESDREQAFWNANNWQGLCTRCHNKKSAKERTT